MRKISKLFILTFLLIMIVTLSSSCSKSQNKSNNAFLNIRVNDSKDDISLSLDPSKDYTTGLDTKAIDNFSQTSPAAYLFANQFAKIGELHRERGDISFDKTYGYSFYIVNTTSNFQDVTVRLKLTMTKDDGLSDAIRVMTYYEESGVQNFRVYQKNDEIPTTYTAYSMIDARNARKYFSKNATLVFDTNSVDGSNENIHISGKKGTNFIKYTILFWLEGDDPDCNENILGKKSKFKLELSTIK